MEMLVAAILYLEDKSKDANKLYGTFYDIHKHINIYTHTHKRTPLIINSHFNYTLTHFFNLLILSIFIDVFMEFMPQYICGSSRITCSS